ncbi:MAG TPA: CCA tRNA nucleotidyltransferase [Chakrabartia sp.]|nr:CCA tRNA nucleotidyltransferase [Chakrabartia sp.]
MDRLSLTLPEGLEALTRVLGAEEGLIRLVGGAVRDALVGLAPKDVDLATRLLPEDAMRRARAAGYKVIPTGLAHGTVTIVVQGRPYEATTLRRDVSTDGRHATVAFSEDWREDAARRDFTINALYADPLTGDVFDYFGGRDDLAAGCVRFIGDPLTRIAEDHLRILRFFRFQARFGKGPPDAASLEACTARANDLMALSRERIADELLKLLSLPDPAGTVALMMAQGIFRPVLPEIPTDGLAALQQAIEGEVNAGLAPDAMRRLSALLPTDPVLADGVGARLKLSNAQRKFLSAVAARAPQDRNDPRALAYHLGRDVALARLLAGGFDATPILNWEIPVFPLGGRAVMARGISAGPEVARILKAVESKWVAEGFPGEGRVKTLLDEVTGG